MYFEFEILIFQLICSCMIGVTIIFYLLHYMVVFVLFDSLRPIINPAVKQGRVFLG